MRVPATVDVAVIGGGPAGSTLAASLARRGREVALFERDIFPRGKVCGEFLSPEVIDCLEKLGCLESFYRFSPPAMTRARICAGDQSVELALPGPAYGLSRMRLDAFLFEEASKAGVQAFEGTSVQRVEMSSDARRGSLWVRRQGTAAKAKVEAGLVVGAYGRRSGLDRKLKRPFFKSHSPYVAFKRHHRFRHSFDGAALEGVVELYAFDGGYCGVSFVEGGVVNVCTLFERRLLEGKEIDNGRRFWRFLERREGLLGHRMAMLEPCDAKTYAVAQIPLMPKQPQRQELLFVGDAAGMIAPLAGDGQAMALEGALSLAGLIDRHWPQVPRHQWRRHWRARYEPRIRLGQVLQRWMIRPEMAGMAIVFLKRFPSIGRALIGLTRA